MPLTHTVRRSKERGFDGVKDSIRPPGFVVATGKRENFMHRIDYTGRLRLRLSSQRYCHRPVSYNYLQILSNGFCGGLGGKIFL